jgi:hypothetical protein
MHALGTAGYLQTGILGMPKKRFIAKHQVCRLALVFGVWMRTP